MKNKILLTGATGFVGGRVMEHIDKRRLIISGRSELSGDYTFFPSKLTGGFEYGCIFDEVDCVIHCAARAHVMYDAAERPIDVYRDINVYGTLNLARQAARSGVRRFIFLSSIKVHGNSFGCDRIIFHDDIPSPEDDYGVSKYEAEAGLFEIANEFGMELVVIRPPLVYGPSVKGNFRSMIELVNNELPLPLGAIYNRRSLVALDNLVDLIMTCVNHPKAANQIFLVSDDQDISTTELLKKMASAFGKKSRLIPVPVSWLWWGAKLVGKGAVAERLFGSLQVDISHTKDVLGWTPPVTMEQQLAKIAASLSTIPDN